MPFTFTKNDRGISSFTFPIMRKLVIPTARRLFSPVVTNPENMPATGPCFIFGNHANYFDPFFINLDMTDEPTAGVMTRDQFHKTLPRIFMDSIGIVPTSKYVPEPGIVRSVMKMIDKRRMIVIFPEGGRRWSGKPKPLIETTLKLFWKMSIPVHPVQIHGSYLSWPRWADKPRKSTIEVRWLDPLHSSDFTDYQTFADTCRNLIDFDEYNPPDSVQIHSCSKPASGIERFLFRCPETGESGAVFSPDGLHVYSRTSPLSYRMNLRSRLVDPQGKPHSIVDMFETISKMPMVMDRNSVLLSNPGCKINEINKDHDLIKKGPGFTELTPDSLLLSLGAEKTRISIEDILYMSVEQNHKVTITTTSGIHQVELRNASALQWKNYITRLKDGESPVRSLQ
ncbi:lysophospholipid acyltransferase family protein [Rhodohalobacter sp. 8-1]|uniref:lysophospholipid acyltransferase family protein n=1 Tax=Rhodohalobacter sp. 8-1 TaxID=3131972 RepID=UPI0030EF3D43